MAEEVLVNRKKNCISRGSNFSDNKNPKAITWSYQFFKLEKEQKGCNFTLQAISEHDKSFHPKSNTVTEYFLYKATTYISI
jgi:hypothetical protein